MTQKIPQGTAKGIKKKPITASSLGAKKYSGTGKNSIESRQINSIYKKERRDLSKYKWYKIKYV